MAIQVLLILGFWIGLLIYGKYLKELIDMKLRRSYYHTPYYHYHKSNFKRSKAGFLLTHIALTLIILGILDMLVLFSLRR